MKPVGGDDNRQLRVALADLGQPALAGGKFTTLFAVTIAIGYRLRGQRKHLAHLGVKHSGLQDLMKYKQWKSKGE